MPPPPETPKYRFPSPEDIVRPQSGPPKFTLTTQQAGQMGSTSKPVFATPVPVGQRRQLDGNAGSLGRRTISFDRRHRGFSPDPDLMTPQPMRSDTATISRNKRRRSFDLDEIDEDLLVGKPKVLGPSSSGLKYTGFTDSTPVPVRGSQVTGASFGPLAPHATPTPAAKRKPLFKQESSVILSSPPPNLNLSFGDTQEDVQEGSEAEDKDSPIEEQTPAPQKKKHKSTGVFDDIESIASSLPSRIDNIDDDDEPNDEDQKDFSKHEDQMNVLSVTANKTKRKGRKSRKENDVPFSSNFPLPPPRVPFTPMKSIQGFGSQGIEGDNPESTTKQWISVPNLPQLNIQQLSPSAKINKAISAMAWSPSHRRRRNANSKYLTGGLASTVLGWAFDAQDSVLRNNAIMEQTPHLHDGAYVVSVDLLWEEENYAAVLGTAEYQSQPEEISMQDKREARLARVILIGDADSVLRKKLSKDARIEVRAPTWEITICDCDIWTVAINWSAKGLMADTITD